MYRYNFPHRKEKRKLEAAARTEAYSKLTPYQKLEQLDKYSFTAAKHRAKLHLLIEKSKKS